MPITLKQQHGDHARSIEELNIQKVLNSLKKQSEQLLDSETREDIKTAMLKKQSTTYELMLLTQQEYIAHQFTKLKTKDLKNEAVAGIELLTQKFILNHQLSKGNESQILLKNLSPQSFSQINNQLKQKLSQITNNINSIPSQNPKSITSGNNSSPGYQQLSKSFSLAQRSQSPIKNSTKLMSIDKNKLRENVSQILQFREAGYWLKNEEKTKKIKEFLEHHQKLHHERHKRYQQSVEKSWQKIQQQKQRQMQSKQESQKQILRKVRQKSLNYKQKRENWQQEHESQLQKIQQFFQKLNVNQDQKRLHELLEQNFNQQLQKQQQEYQQKLQKIKEQHAPLDPDQFDEHLQKYQEYKESLKQELQLKKEEFQQQLEQAKEHISSLYHSKRYQKVANQTQSPYKRSLSDIAKLRSKRKQFVLDVKEKFKPQVSHKKRQQIQETIRLLQLSQDKSKRKLLKNGQIEYEDKEQTDHKKKGLEYLASLRNYLENKPKKQPRPTSTSALENSQIKKIDYLRDNKPNVQFKTAMIEWKRVMEDDKFNSKDKYTFLKESISTLEHKALEKEIEARNLKKSGQELEKKDQFDKFYIESIEAKMAILNKLMLSKK